MKKKAIDASHPGLKPALDAGLQPRAAEHLLAFYDEPHRYYHNRVHIREMLDAALKHELKLSAAQTFAVLARKLRQEGPALEAATEQQAVGAEATGAAVGRIHALVTRIHDTQREQGDASELVLRTVESIHSSQHDQVTTIREMEVQGARDRGRSRR